ncbi:GTP 3',8-cyclase MoaA [Candidatus Omnitrophota bacterium]
MEIQKVDYLRLSITDKCNLDCSYCNPAQKGEFLTHDEVMRYEEMRRVVKVCVGLGIRAVRITGGEPLIKKNITDLVRMLKEIDGLKELSMTTNGVYLKDMAPHLKKAGLDRINISIDTLGNEKYKTITGQDRLDDVWEGIHSAIDAGLEPVKLNAVVMKGVNDDELLDFARLTLRHPLIVRFVEFFPTTKRSKGLMHYAIDNIEVKNKIMAHFGQMMQVSEIKGNGPARYYKLKDSSGAIGFISSFSSDFCGDCNRMRIDCAGKISPCLFSGHTYDLREVIRKQASDDELRALIRNVINMKSEYNKNETDKCAVEMSSIGG